jgi:cell wall-associated NlpC family hydrolase
MLWMRSTSQLSENAAMNAIDIGEFFIPLAIVFTYMPSWAAGDFASIDVEQQSQTAINSVEATASELIVDALQFIGVKYKYGGKNLETGFDCSGFVSHVFREATGVARPPNAARMALLGQNIESEDLEPGDWFFTKRSATLFPT